MDTKQESTDRVLARARAQGFSHITARAIARAEGARAVVNALRDYALEAEGGQKRILLSTVNVAIGVMREAERDVDAARAAAIAAWEEFDNTP